jgi:hypothetical protein
LSGVVFDAHYGCLHRLAMPSGSRCVLNLRHLLSGTWVAVCEVADPVASIALRELADRVNCVAIDSLPRGREVRTSPMCMFLADVQHLEASNHALRNRPCTSGLVGVSVRGCGSGLGFGVSVRDLVFGSVLSISLGVRHQAKACLVGSRHSTEWATRPGWVAVCEVCALGFIVDLRWPAR